MSFAVQQPVWLSTRGSRRIPSTAWPAVIDSLDTAAGTAQLRLLGALPATRSTQSLNQPLDSLAAFDPTDKDKTKSALDSNKEGFDYLKAMMEAKELLKQFNKRQRTKLKKDESTAILAAEPTSNGNAAEHDAAAAGQRHQRNGKSRVGKNAKADTNAAKEAATTPAAQQQTPTAPRRRSASRDTRDSPQSAAPAASPTAKTSTGRKSKSPKPASDAEPSSAQDDNGGDAVPAAKGSSKRQSPRASTQTSAAEPSAEESSSPRQKFAAAPTTASQSALAPKQISPKSQPALTNHAKPQEEAAEHASALNGHSRRFSPRHNRDSDPTPEVAASGGVTSPPPGAEPAPAGNRASKATRASKKQPPSPDDAGSASTSRAASSSSSRSTRQAAASKSDARATDSSASRPQAASSRSSKSQSGKRSSSSDSSIQINSQSSDLSGSAAESQPRAKRSAAQSKVANSQESSEHSPAAAAQNKKRGFAKTSTEDRSDSKAVPEASSKSPTTADASSAQQRGKRRSSGEGGEKPAKKSGKAENKVEAAATHAVGNGMAKSSASAASKATTQAHADNDDDDDELPEIFPSGQNTPSSGSTYSERALVWAKFHTHPFWPARLERRQEKHKWLVRFVDDQVHHQVVAVGEKNLRPWRGDDHAKLEAEANNQNYADAERLQRAIRLTDAAIMQRLNGARTEEDLLLFDGIVHNSPLRRPRKGEAAAVGEAAASSLLNLPTAYEPAQRSLDFMEDDGDMPNLVHPDNHPRAVEADLNDEDRQKLAIRTQVKTEYEKHLPAVLPLLSGILLGTTPCERLDTFKLDPKSASRFLCTGPFDEDAVEQITNLAKERLGTKHSLSPELILSVLVPEALIFLLQKIKRVDREAADKLMAEHYETEAELEAARKRIEGQSRLLEKQKRDRAA